MLSKTPYRVVGDSGRETMTLDVLRRLCPGYPVHCKFTSELKGWTALPALDNITPPRREGGDWVIWLWVSRERYISLVGDNPLVKTPSPLPEGPVPGLPWSTRGKTFQDAVSAAVSALTP